MRNLPKKLIISSPAKLNLYLAVLDVRGDGFHGLKSVFLATDFADILRFKSREGENFLEITMKARYREGTESYKWKNLNSIPLSENIIYKAVSLFRNETGFAQPLKVDVEKRVPPGSGLGGGSSNAAAALLALNTMAGFPCKQETLLKMASSLGSDVPFFLHNASAAWVAGRGERVSPLETPGWFFVLVNPGFPSDTAAAFRQLDEHRARSEKIMKPQRASVPLDSGIPWFSSRFLDGSDMFSRFNEIKFQGKVFWNDFLEVSSEPEKSIYNDIIFQLLELSADYAGLSGTGSTCFGVFKEKKKARKAAFFMRKKWSFTAFCGLKR